MQSADLTAAQTELLAAWEEHTRCEFEAHDVEGTMATMTEGAHIINVPTLTGGVGLSEVRDFYTHYFIPQLPPDTETELVSRTVGSSQIVDELIFKFTHSISMAWMLPGIAPTHKHVAIPLVVIIGFKKSKVISEHIYWDQASVLKQLGLLTESSLPIAGGDSAEKIINPQGIASNQLIQRLHER